MNEALSKSSYAIVEAPKVHGPIDERARKPTYVLVEAPKVHGPMDEALSKLSERAVASQIGARETAHRCRELSAASRVCDCGVRERARPIPNNLMASIPQILPLFRELNDLKRIRAAGMFGSMAERGFRRSWWRLIAGESLEVVALSETANAVIAAKLAGIDAQVLADGGLNAAQRLEVLHRAFDASANALPPDFAARLRAHIAPDALYIEESAPEFVELLAMQPRAGATRPNHARVVLEPTENHAEHCGIVAVNGALAASLYGADAGAAFLTGLSHHFHNAYLPDAGDAGDALLGEHHARLMETFRERALAQLPDALAARARASLDHVYRSDTPAAKAFQVADSLDRVLEMEWHARSAQFTLDVALGQMDIIHAGPVQAFQLEVMREAGLK